MCHQQASVRVLISVIAACCISLPTAVAKKPTRPGGGGGGGGGSALSYTIVDLVGPYHDVDGWSQTYAEQIADVSAAGSAHIVGRYLDLTLPGSTYHPCLWTIDELGVTVEDLRGTLDQRSDINSAGVIAGTKDGQPALRLASGQTVYLESDGGIVTGLNNPDGANTFQAVGHIYSEVGARSVLWDVSLDGTVVSRQPLLDADGNRFFASDINDLEIMAGYLESANVPAVGAFDGNGQIQVTLLDNPNPVTIDSFYDFQIDDGVSLLGFGYQTGPTGGYYGRAVIWPGSGEALDLTAETGLFSTEGNGIALVDGTTQVVGAANDSRDWFAYLYTNGSLTELQSVASGDQSWTLTFARDVNTSGMICGDGRVGRKRNFQDHAFVLLRN